MTFNVLDNTCQFRRIIWFTTGRWNRGFDRRLPYILAVSYTHLTLPTTPYV